MLNSPYCLSFRRSIVFTQELITPLQRKFYIGKGLVWLRRDQTKRSFASICRNPTLGCRVELFAIPHPGCVHINSPEALKLISKLCYI